MLAVIKLVYPALLPEAPQCQRHSSTREKDGEKTLRAFYEYKKPPHCPNALARQSQAHMKSSAGLSFVSQPGLRISKRQALDF